MIKLMSIGGLLLSGGYISYLNTQRANTVSNLDKRVNDSLNNQNECRAQLERIEGLKVWEEFTKTGQSEDKWLVFRWTNWNKIERRQSLFKKSCDEQANLSVNATEKAERASQKLFFMRNVTWTTLAVSACIIIHQFANTFTEAFFTLRE